MLLELPGARIDKLYDADAQRGLLIGVRALGAGLLPFGKLKITAR